jgi:DNA-binding response OmpR family regulator
MTERPIHVILADDDHDILRLFSGKLAKAGYEVLPAHDGNEAREMARRFQPDLILLDIHMPVLDGYKTLEYLKHDKETAHIPVAFLTNEDLSIESEKAWKEMGASGYLAKSELPEVLLASIAAILREHDIEPPKPRDD